MMWSSAWAVIYICILLEVSKSHALIIVFESYIQLFQIVWLFHQIRQLTCNSKLFDPTQTEGAYHQGARTPVPCSVAQMKDCNIVWCLLLCCDMMKCPVHANAVISMKSRRNVWISSEGLYHSDEEQLEVEVFILSYHLWQSTTEQLQSCVRYIIMTFKGQAEKVFSWWHLRGLSLVRCQSQHPPPGQQRPTQHYMYHSDDAHAVMYRHLTVHACRDLLLLCLHFFAEHLHLWL